MIVTSGGHRRWECCLRGILDRLRLPRRKLRRSRRGGCHTGSPNGQLQLVGRPDGPDVLVYRTPAFETPHVIAGPITATLFVKTTASETDLFVQICDESEAGVVPLQRGLLRASFSTLDEDRTVYTDDGDVLRPYRPHESMDPVVPGEMNRYDVEVFPVAHILRPGHKLQIRVSAPPVTDGL
jgi:predicted acyl esterase